MFSLIDGNPDETPASFSRFVLPFAYQLLPDDGGTAVYESDEAPEIWRRRYLTYETAQVLFGRARWFRLSCLDPEAGSGFFNLPGERRLRAKMAAPRLVLFEYPVSGQTVELDKLRTGFLIVELYFPKEETNLLNPPEISDFLYLNELFRYWRKPYLQHERDGSVPGGRGYAEFLKEWPYGLHGGKLGDESEDTWYWGRWQGLLTLPILHADQEPKHRKLLLSIPSEERGDWSIHADDRTYVWTCALLEKGGNALRAAFPPKSDPPSDSPLAAHDYGHWIKLLNVDSPGETPEATHATRLFEREWAKPLTYRRWEESGTFYGFTPHSGAMLGPRISEPPLWEHFGQMYFDQILLLLYVRTTLFRFSEEITRISARARNAGEHGHDEWRRAFESLRRDFALFTNLYQFPSLSNQQQAVEMYKIARKAMEIDDLFREVQSEINASHDYLVMLNEQRQAEMSTLLTVVATGGLVIGLATGILGMNVLVEDWKKSSLGTHSDWFVVALVLLFCLVFMSAGVACSKPIAGFIRMLSKLPDRIIEKRWFRKSKSL